MPTIIDVPDDAIAPITVPDASVVSLDIPVRVGSTMLGLGIQGGRLRTIGVAPGAVGAGIPADGADDTFLTKASAADNDTSWDEIPNADAAVAGDFVVRFDAAEADLYIRNDGVDA